mmetsp:Transcript_18154/g.27137  ORF Transcript_18154/g.27137 Transcript_18154/m.27137 type:complete len:225 (-) Transcript_18154:1072-1746(-)
MCFQPTYNKCICILELIKIMLRHHSYRNKHKESMFQFFSCRIVVSKVTDMLTISRYICLKAKGGEFVSNAKKIPEKILRTSKDMCGTTHNNLYKCRLFRIRLHRTLNHTDSDCLSHVTNSKPSQRWEIRKTFHTKRLGRFHLHNTSIAILNIFWIFFNNFPSTTIHQFFDIRKYTCHVCCMTIDNWCVSIANFSWMIHHDNLCIEGGNACCWLIICIGCYVSTT